jgi:hypothetical protein
MKTVPRNAPCLCGSGKKYKHCHLGTSVEGKKPLSLVPLLLLPIGFAAAVYVGMDRGLGLGLAIAAATIIIVGLIITLRDPPPPTKGGDPSAINFGG